MKQSGIVNRLSETELIDIFCHSHRFRFSPASNSTGNNLHWNSQIDQWKTKLIEIKSEAHDN